jgi:hypothetical protein
VAVVETRPIAESHRTEEAPWTTPEDLNIVEFTNRDRRLLKAFVKFPWRLYKDEPNYVPPLNMDLLGSRLLGHVGLLTDKHPFHRHADVTYFLAYRDGAIVGRVAGCVDKHHNRDNEAEDVIFGFFECIDDQDVARTLLERVMAWGKSKGMKRLLGPMSFNTNFTIGVQLDAYDTLPFFETAHNFPYYPKLMDGCGLGKAMDVIAQALPLTDPGLFRDAYEKAQERVEIARQKYDVTIRPVNLNDFENEMAVFKEVYNEAWRQNWGATAITDDEFRLIAGQLRAVAEPETILFAFMGAEPVAVFAIMPDFHDCIKRKHNIWDRSDLARIVRMFRTRKKTRRGRVVMLGIKEKYRRNGVKDLLIVEGMDSVLKSKRYDMLELSWLLETNELIIKTGQAYNAKKYKTWRIYEKDLTC